MSRRTEGFAVGQPAAGSDISITPSTNESCRILAIRAQFVASSTVQNRFARFGIKTQDDLLVAEFGANAAWTASNTYTIEASIAIRATASMNEGGQVGPLVPFPDFWLPPDWDIITTTDGIQSGDQWENITVLCEFSTHPHKHVEIAELVIP